MFTMVGATNGQGSVIVDVSNLYDMAMANKQEWEKMDERMKEMEATIAALKKNDEQGSKKSERAKRRGWQKMPPTTSSSSSSSPSSLPNKKQKTASPALQNLTDNPDDDELDIDLE